MRRAVSLSSLLVFLACAATQETTPPALTAPSPTPPISSNSPAQEQERLLARAPSLTISDPDRFPGCEARAQEVAQNVNAIRERYEHVARVRTLPLPGCAPTRCEERWYEILEGVSHAALVCLCGDYPLRSVRELWELHEKHLSEVVQGTLDQIGARAQERFGWGAVGSLERLRQKVRGGCPLYECTVSSMPRVVFRPASAVVPAAMAAELTDAAGLLEGPLCDYYVLVKGNRAPTEPEGMAEQRAEALAQYLMALGVSAERLVVVSEPLPKPNADDDDRSVELELSREMPKVAAWRRED